MSQSTRLGRIPNSITERYGPLVSVAGVAPAFLVRETSVLLLDDTDKAAGERRRRSGSFRRRVTSPQIETAALTRRGEQRARNELQPRPGPTISRRGSLLLSLIRLPEVRYILAVIVTVIDVVGPHEKQSRDRLGSNQRPSG